MIREKLGDRFKYIEKKTFPRTKALYRSFSNKSHKNLRSFIGEFGIF